MVAQRTAIVSLAVIFARIPAAAEDALDIGFLGIWDRAVPLVERAVRETEIRAGIVGLDDPMERLSVLFILNIDPKEAVALRKRLTALPKEGGRPRVIPLDRRGTHTELEREGLLEKDDRVRAYWRANGAANIRRLLRYAAVTYLGQGGEIEPPLTVPDFGYYHPDLKEPAAHLETFRAGVSWRNGGPKAVLLIQQSFWITEDTAVIDAQIRALERHGFNVVTIFGDTALRIQEMVRAVRPDIVIEDRHGSLWEGDARGDFLSELDVPYLRPISMLRYTVEEWMRDPRGLSYADRSLFLTVQEPKGTIEPLVVGGLKESIQGFRLHVPIPDRVERFAARAAAWVRLRRKPNSRKRLAIVYYNKYLGKSDLMRGSPTGGFLNAPASLLRFLPRLRDAGFNVFPLPADEAELIAWIRARGRNIGPWAQGELEALADKADTVLVPASQYEEWFTAELDEARRRAVTQRFGPPPGRLMVVTRNGRKFIVLPGIRLGNILLAPQPARGERQDSALLHSRDVPPPHNYLAFYWWLAKGFGADAVIHWGTHGSVELLPGKEAGLSKDDWSDICVGVLPVINPWIMDNLGEATLARRRSYAVLVDHLVPPAVNAGLTDELRRLHDDIDKYETLAPGLLREEFRRTIGDSIRAAGIDETLHIDLSARAPTDEEIRRVSTYLHEIYNTTTPATLHVLGQPPDEKRLIPYLVTILGRRFLERLAAVQAVPPAENRLPGDREKWLRARAQDLVRRVILQHGKAPPGLEKDLEFAKSVAGRLRRAGDEIENLLRALEGRFVPPGPGPDPVRNPASIPPGRNLYALNPEEIPTRASWEVAVRLVDEMLRTRMPRKVGMDLNGMNTMRDFGVMEAQILYLMGVRPVWDRNGLVVDVEVIPQSELGRPRIDVFIAMGGQYKENFPSRVELLDKAVRIISILQEEENFVRYGTERLYQQLLARGFAEERARTLAAARIFGTKPGNLSGTNILYLVPRSGVWESDGEIASVYIDSMSYVYTSGVWGKKIEGLYEEAIRDTEILVRVWASNMTSQLSNHHAYEYLGGLSMAVEKLTGRRPAALIADVRSPAGARMREFEEVLSTNLRAELLNRRWIQGMKEHDYAGAGHMAELVKNTFGWQVTRQNSVGDRVWNDIYDIYVKDRYRLKLREWFEYRNPHALEEIAATLLEAARKKYWKPGPEPLRDLAHLYAKLVVSHGPSAGLITGGNQDLQKEVLKWLNAPGDVGLRNEFTAAMARVAGEPPADRLRGTKLKKVEEAPQVAEHKRPASWFPLAGFLVVVLVLLVIGLWRRIGVPS